MLFRCKQPSSKLELFKSGATQTNIDFKHPISNGNTERDFSALTAWGWNEFFEDQLDKTQVDVWPVRVTHVHRTSLVVHDGTNANTIPLDQLSFSVPPEDPPTVGDWLLSRTDSSQLIGILARKSVFRRARTHNRSEFQLIAANIDFLFVLSSCNEEFNESRLERYLVTAHECGLTTVVVLTKRDTCDDTDVYVSRARAFPTVDDVVAIDARDSSTFEKLRPYFADHKTVGLVGSSGVGKSTLVNSLLSTDVQATGSLRSDKVRGRHTTSARTLICVPSGGLIVDVPGMREFGLMDVRASLEEMFCDIMELEQSCKFSDCRHDTEPGCAVKRALDEGKLNNRRLASYQKLIAEEAERSHSRSKRLNEAKKDQRIS